MISGSATFRINGLEGNVGINQELSTQETCGSPEDRSHAGMLIKGYGGVGEHVRAMVGCFDRAPADLQEAIHEIVANFHYRDAQKYEDGSVGTIDISPLQLRNALAYASIACWNAAIEAAARISDEQQRPFTAQDVRALKR